MELENPPNDLANNLEPPPNNPPPPEDVPITKPHYLEDLIGDNLNELRGFETAYANIPTLCPMFTTLNTIIENMEKLTQQHNAALLCHDSMHAQFDDGLDYDQVMNLNITKHDIANLFVDPKTSLTLKKSSCQLNGAQIVQYVTTFGTVGGWFLIDHLTIIWTSHFILLKNCMLNLCSVTR